MNNLLEINNYEVLELNHQEMVETEGGTDPFPPNGCLSNNNSGQNTSTGYNFWNTELGKFIYSFVEVKHSGSTK